MNEQAEAPEAQYCLYVAPLAHFQVQSVVICVIY